MESLLLILLVLACPLSMVVIGLGAWAITRLHSEKRDPPVGYMGGRGEHQDAAAAENDAGLKDQVTELEREIASLRTRVDRSSGGDGA